MLTIDKIVLSSNVLLAPMSGVTDLPYRKLVKKFGAGLVISEMVASMSMILSTRQALRKAAIMIDDATNSCVQLAGCNPEIIAESARLNEDMGAKIIDLNFGCPAKNIVGGQSGAALMRDELLAARIFESTVNAVKIPVTLKMRLGWDENTKNASTLAKIAENSGIKMITVHGRTRAQFYSGQANWEAIREVKNVVSIPVIANGDITNYEKAKECIKQSGADGIMIGRGAYGKPWFINDVARFLKTGIAPEELSIKDKLQVISEHYDEIINYYGERDGVKIARKHIGWYSSGYPNSAEFRAKINLLDNVMEVKKEIYDYFYCLQEKISPKYSIN